jgi:hypothetical protein
MRAGILLDVAKEGEAIILTPARKLYYNLVKSTEPTPHKGVSALCVLKNSLC